MNRNKREEVTMNKNKREEETTVINQGSQEEIKISDKIKKGRNNYIKTGYRNNIYYKQFNNREQEISKDKRGIGLIEGESRKTQSKLNISQLLEHLR